MVSSSAPLPPQYALAERAAGFDADVFRAIVETIGCLALADEVFARPGLCGTRSRPRRPPDRVRDCRAPRGEELLALLA